MKSGQRDDDRFWIDLPVVPKKEKHKVLIEFFALRDLGKNIWAFWKTYGCGAHHEVTGREKLLD